MWAYYCLSDLKEEEILSGQNSRDNSPKRKNINKNTLSKESISISPQRNTKEETNYIFSSSKNSLNQRSDLFGLEILDEINKYRIKHGVEELIFDKNITKISQKYAEKCARENEREFCPDNISSSFRSLKQ